MATAVISNPPKRLVQLARRRGISRVKLAGGDWILMLPDLPRASWDDLWDFVLDHRDANNRKLRTQIIRRRREFRRGRSLSHVEVWKS